MNATYVVTTTSGKSYKWYFEEGIVDPNDYGNKKYISYTMPSGDTFMIDCRYNTNYNFTKICVEFLINWYGDNLDELYEEDEDEEIADPAYFSDGMHW